MKNNWLNLLAAGTFLFSAGASELLLDNPAAMTKVMHGKSDDRAVTLRSQEVQGKPETSYECSAEIRMSAKTAKTGRLRFRVREIAPDGKSIIYNDIAQLGATTLDFTTHKKIFRTGKRTAKLQVYLILDRFDGTAQMRNLKLRELSPEEYEAYQAERRNQKPAFFSPPLYAYSGEKKLPWGYRVSADFVQPAKLPVKIVFEIPALAVKAETAVKVNIHAASSVKLGKALVPGKYPVVMTAFNKENKEVLREEFTLRVLEDPKYPAVPEVKSSAVSPDGLLLVNDKPVLVNGLYHVYSQTDLKEIRAAGFNAARIWAETPEKYVKFLDMCRKGGVYAGCVLKLKTGEPLKALAAAISRHPALLNYDLVDEPAIRNIKPARILPCTREIRALDANHYRQISFSDYTAVPEYLACCDAVSSHKYVIPFDGVGKTASVAAFLDQHCKAAKPRKAVLLTLQSWVHWHDETKKPQTAEETRAMAYLALLNGARGLWWYTFRDPHYDVRSIPHLWSCLKGLNYELNALAPRILAGYPELKKQNAIQFAVWDFSGKPLLIAVNTGKVPAELALPEGSWSELYGNDRVLQGKITLSPTETIVAELR